MLSHPFSTKQDPCTHGTGRKTCFDDSASVDLHFGLPPKRTINMRRKNERLSWETYKNHCNPSIQPMDVVFIISLKLNASSQEKTIRFSIVTLKKKPASHEIFSPSWLTLVWRSPPKTDSNAKLEAPRPMTSPTFVSKWWIFRGCIVVKGNNKWLHRWKCVCIYIYINIICSYDRKMDALKGT